jgi:hypothetical protein
MKADIFMRTPNTLFYSDKALFDEMHFPRCANGHSCGKMRGVMQLDQPAVENQPPMEDGVTPGDDDLPPPEPPKGGSTPQPLGWTSCFKQRFWTAASPASNCAPSTRS